MWCPYRAQVTAILSLWIAYSALKLSSGSELIGLIDKNANECKNEDCAVWDRLTNRCGLINGNK